MKAKLLTIASVFALSVSVGASAMAETVAGWDFSQYFSDGLLTTNGTTYTNTLDANYSSRDTTFNAGADAATYGSMYMNGSHGSSTETASGDQSTDDVVPTAGSLRSNLDGPVSGFGDNAFESHSILKEEGQTFTERMALTARDAASIVFEADLSSLGAQAGSDWEVSFGGKTISGTSTVTVEFSKFGNSYTSYGSVMLDTDDTEFTVALDSGEAGHGFVRLGLSPSGSDQPIIDNVAIHATVPEPGLMVLLVAGVAGLLVLPRRV
jgi:hypothetical protein